MADLYRQCVLRKGNRFFAALWIPSVLAKVGMVLDICVTHPYKGHWLDWSCGWTVHEAWAECPLKMRVVRVSDTDAKTAQILYPAKARKHDDT